MIALEKKQEDFENRQQYLVALAIKYIESHSGYVGIDDDIFYDEAECDGGALAYDLMVEFNLSEEDLE
jgi:hypothetical protein